MVDYLALEVSELIHAAFDDVLHELAELGSDDSGLIHDPADRSFAVGCPLDDLGHLEHQRPLALAVGHKLSYLGGCAAHESNNIVRSAAFK